MQLMVVWEGVLGGILFLEFISVIDLMYYICCLIFFIHFG